MGCAGTGVDLEFAAETRDQNFEVKLTHTGDDGLAGFMVGPNLESRVFVPEFVQGQAKLLLVGFGFGFDGQRDDGFRESNGFQNNGLVLITESVAGFG